MQRLAEHKTGKIFNQCINL